MLAFLRKNIDVFAWNAYEALGLDLDLIFHHLNVNPAILPTKQPPQRSSKQHSDVVKEEVTKLKQARAIKEVFYPEWLDNTVVVKKKNWKMADMCGLHRSKQGLPKRSSPYASNRSTSGHHCRSSSDELFKLFSRIPPNTFSFRRSRENSFYYSYWELPLQSDALWVKECRGYLPKDMTRMFEPHLGKSIEIYIDYMVVKIIW